MENKKITAEDFGLREDESKPPLRDENIIFYISDMFSNPTIRFSDVITRRFNIIKPMQESARQEIQAEEDRVVFEALDSVAAQYELGATIAFPIRNLNYQGIARRIFSEEPMPQGANPDGYCSGLDYLGKSTT
ncbi:MAG: hypothetical protein WC516_07070 [Patescibacteria group bacterium]|jgi:hypothetical protein